MTGADSLIASLGPALVAFAGVLVSGLVVPALGLVMVAGFSKKAVDAA